MYKVLEESNVPFEQKNVDPWTEEITFGHHSVRIVQQESPSKFGDVLEESVYIDGQYTPGEYVEDILDMLLSLFNNKPVKGGA